MSGPPREISPVNAREIVDFFAFMRCTDEVKTLISRYAQGSDDGFVVVGSNFHRRLQIICVEDSLEQALLTVKSDPENAPGDFDTLLKSFEDLRAQISGLEGAGDVDWFDPRMKIFRQVALSCIRAQLREAEGLPHLKELSDISPVRYLETVDQHLPAEPSDTDTELEAYNLQKERRNLTDIYADSSRKVSAVKMQSIFMENRLDRFRKDLTDFLRGLESRFIPEPELFKRQGLGLMNSDSPTAEPDSANFSHNLREQGRSGTHALNTSKRLSKDGVTSRGRNVRAKTATEPEGEGYAKALSLAKANETLQADMAKMGPGTVAEALANGNSPVPSSSMFGKRRTRSANSDTPTGDRRDKPSTPKARNILQASNEGEQVYFSDSQSADEPPVQRLTLTKHPAPETPPALPDAPEIYKSKRHPWSKEEVKYLQKGVKECGVGNWTKILRMYKFHDKRRSVDLKDKWRNLNK